MVFWGEKIYEGKSSGERGKSRTKYDNKPKNIKGGKEAEKREERERERERKKKIIL